MTQSGRGVRDRRGTERGDTETAERKGRRARGEEKGTGSGGASWLGVRLPE